MPDLAERGREWLSTYDTIEKQHKRLAEILFELVHGPKAMLFREGAMQYTVKDKLHDEMMAASVAMIPFTREAFNEKYKHLNDATEET